MSRAYRVGIIGFGHMHINSVAQVYAGHPQVTMAACADTVPAVPELRAAPYTREWNRRHNMEACGIPQYYDDYVAMLAQERLDIAIVTCENAQHPAVAEACAAAGVHVCVEKPMAASLSDALRMVRACQAHGTRLIVNWPLTWMPNARKAKELVEAGVIGRVLEVKWRSGHTGPLGAGAAHAGVDDVAAPMSGPERGATWWHQTAAGGGAMLDYCCYGAMVSRWYVGQPAVAAVGLRANLDSPWGDADDNGAMIVRFPEAMALLEGSWTTWDHGVLTGPIIYGTHGTLVVQSIDDRPVVRLERGHAPLAPGLGGEAARAAEGSTVIFESDPLPAGRANVAEEYIHHLETGEPLHPTLQALNNLEYMAILDAGVRSTASGKMEIVDNVAWRIG